MQNQQATKRVLKIGDQVTIEDDHQLTTGTIKEFIHFLLNGREHAVIQMDQPQPGSVRCTVSAKNAPRSFPKSIGVA